MIPGWYCADAHNSLHINLDCAFAQYISSIIRYTIIKNVNVNHYAIITPKI